MLVNRLHVIVLLCTAATGAGARPKHGPQPNPAKPPSLGVIRSQGCFSSLVGTDAVAAREPAFRKVTNCSGTCARYCIEQGKAVAMTGGVQCYCSDTYPPRERMVEDDVCVYPCAGYPFEGCGSRLGAFSVYNTGIRINVVHVDNVEDEPAESAGVEKEKGLGDGQRSKDTEEEENKTPGQSSNSDTLMPGPEEFFIDFKGGW